ncbi:MAG: 6,7-dimethyl-8-ribityllumazine synthase [Bauldia sp.]
MVATAQSRAPVPPARPGTKVLVIEARYYEGIADELFRGVRLVLDEAGAVHERIAVPGVLEIAAALAMALRGPVAYDGFVVLGCVIRGETTHYDIVAGESARVIADISAKEAIALGNGILTVENEAQAWARAKVDNLDKGGAAARAALAMIALRHQMGLGR